MSAPIELGGYAQGRELRRNFTCHVVEGGLYIGGLSFVHSHTVLPRVLEQLGAAPWLVALAPGLLSIGFIVPGLFVAHRIEQLASMRRWVVTLGVWQRLPYLLAALMLWFAAMHPELALPAVLCAPLVSGLVGGIAVNAWKEYVASTIPERLRASMWATRFVLGTVLGLGAGGVVSEVLSREPGPRGYAWLHLGTFVCVAISFVVFLGTNERPRPVHQKQQSFSQFLRGVPALVGSDRRFQLYLWARIPVHAIYVLVPFLGIHALRTLGKPDSYLGSLLTFNMLGSLVGYALAGYSGDRHGGRVSMLLAHLGWLVVAAWTPVADASWQFQALFAVLGVALSMSAVGLSTLDLEITPLERRVSFQAVLGVFTLLGLVSASLASALLRQLTENIWALCAPSLVLTVISLVLFYVIEEPRRPAAV
jgi:MFS family permease